MGIAAIVPVLWGALTGQMEAASWVAITAEGICWVELKGNYGQRLRVLAGGTFLALLFTMLGSITGNNIWVSVACMIGVGFMAGLFKNLGDRGSGLSICVYLLFIIANAYPTHTVAALEERLLLVLAGAILTVIVSMAVTVLIPSQQPYRRSIALIWNSIANLIAATAMGWDGKRQRYGLRELYLQEKNVRTAINNSLHFYEQMAHQVSKKDPYEYELAQLRKASALTATHIIAMGEELEAVQIKNIESSLRLKLYALLRALQQTVERMAVFTLNLKMEESLLLASRMNRVNKLVLLLKEYQMPDDAAYAAPLRRFIQLAERTQRLIESCQSRLETIGEDRPMYRSYSLLKTLFVLHPRHWMRNIRLLFNFNTLTARYALRSAVAAGIALFVYKWFEIDHGYWLPFTVIIVLQPYFGATLQKAFDRILGTVAGGLAGGLLLRVETGLYLKVAILFVCFVLMVYFIRKRYSVSAFFITLSVVLLFDVEETLDPMLIATRAGATMGGAVLAIIAGFALLPTWDKTWLPRHLADAIQYNYQYFIATFFAPAKDTNWTRNKRNAETRNSNAFDSFNRYMQEPTLKKKAFIVYYQLITHSVRITRELNNIHLEQEHNTAQNLTSPPPEQQLRINECLQWFNKNMELLHMIEPGKKTDIMQAQEAYFSPFWLSQQQLVYLDKLIIELRAMHQDMAQLQYRGFAQD